MLGNRAAAALSTMSSTSAKKGALIFLHGLGDSPAGWSQLQSSLPQMKPRLKDIAFVFPAAPTIGITINGGAEMPGWFDLYDWPIAVGSKDDREGLMAAVAQIETEVDKLLEAGIPPSKIVLGGFSQGGAVSLLAAYRRKEGEEAFAGCAGLSAWVTLPKELKVTEDAASKTPLFWGHGRMDDKVLFEQQAFGVEKLKAQGVSVTDKAYDMGHSSDPDEMAYLAKFVDEMLFGDSTPDL